MGSSAQAARNVRQARQTPFAKAGAKDVRVGERVEDRHPVKCGWPSTSSWAARP